MWITVSSIFCQIFLRQLLGNIIFHIDIKAIQKRGITILLIEHDMNLVMRVCEKIVVLENGALIAEGTSTEIKRNPRVIEAYLGAEG